MGLAAGTDPAAVLAGLGDSVVSSRPVPSLDAIAVDVPTDRADVSLTTGTSGLCGQCRIISVRVMTGREGTSADTAAGIAWAADHGAQVINASLSTASPSRLLQDAVAYAAAQGALVVASAGNVASRARRYPAAFESTLAVGQVGTAQKNTATDQWVDVATFGTSTR